MNKLLVICGPTATGKTQLGVELAKKFSAKGGGEIVSADSRQVYRGMDIGTGKDLPVSAKFRVKSEKLQLKVKNGQVLKPYRFGEIPVWMLDVVGPGEQFSVAHYYKLANRVIEDIWQRGKLPILVGGTGLYIKALVDGIATLNIPPDPLLRASYAKKSEEELFEILSHLDPIAANRLNASERHNKRRLIRKIEIAHLGFKNRLVKGWDLDVLFIGLTAPYQALYKMIDLRVEKRIQLGMVREVEGLLKSGVSHQRLQEFGLEYRLVDDFLQKKLAKREMIKKLKGQIHSLARRQLTWFKKDNRVNWFDVTKPNWQEKVEKKVGEWYNKNAKFK